MRNIFVLKIKFIHKIHFYKHFIAAKFSHFILISLKMLFFREKVIIFLELYLAIPKRVRELVCELNDENRLFLVSWGPTPHSLFLHGLPHRLHTMG